MTDLELMQLLEDEGYEPSLENLLILKESIKNGEIEILDEETKVTKMINNHAKKYGIHQNETSKNRVYSNSTPSQQLAFNANVAGKDAARGFASGEKKDKYGFSPMENKRFGYDERKQSIESKVKPLNPDQQKAILTKKDTGAHKGNEGRATARKAIANKILVTESFSDYELYQILEENGYITTEENLEILKEGLYNGKIELLTEMRRETKEVIKGNTKATPNNFKRVLNKATGLSNAQINNSASKVIKNNVDNVSNNLGF